MLEDVKITKLDNGACVATSAMKDTNVCHLGFHIPMGSRREKASEARWSHFAEHMILRGSKKYPSQKIINRIMGRFGGINNAETSALWTRFYAHVPAYGTMKTIDILGDAIAHPLFAQPDIEIERKAILEEIRMDADDPSDRLSRLSREALWPEHPLSKPVIGTPESIASIDEKSLKAFHRARYTSRGAMFIAAGKVDHDEIVERVRPVFDGLPDTPATRYRRASPEWPIKPVAIEHCDESGATFVISFRGVTDSDSRKYVLVLLTSILGGDSNSRLFRSVRERHGLAYSVGADFSVGVDQGVICVSASVSPNSIEKALALCGHELKALARKPVGKRELSFQRERFASIAIIGDEADCEGEYYILKECLEKHNKIERIDEKEKRIRSISACELQSLSAEIFRPENCSLALRLPRNCKVSPEKLREALFNG